MIKHAKVLDCTLRDGAYLVDKDFGNDNINGIIKGLVDCGIEYIEIGFLQNEGFADGKTVFKNAADAKRYIPEDKKNSTFTVLADFSRYSIENLKANSGNSFDGVRECFFKHEWKDALGVCHEIKEKGYKVFVQPVDILGYSDLEIIELIDQVNILEPYCLSIVDTFGSMYIEDLRHIFSLMHNNLIPSCKIGFHSHNNMQLSNALSQEFISISLGKRKVVVDTSLCGMGRGAGNTPTELVVQYMVKKLDYVYNIDALLDTVDGYMDNIRARCNWGYSIPYFIAGAYGAHVNNIEYLLRKNCIQNKEIRFILNKIGNDNRKIYDYELLDQTYFNYLKTEIDDSQIINELSQKLYVKKVLLLAPGKSLMNEYENIKKYINENEPIVICVNFISDMIKSDFAFFSNINRYKYWMKSENFKSIIKIITSNIEMDKLVSGVKIVSYMKLIKCGWNYMNNAMILICRLMDQFSITELAIAGFDGYDASKQGDSNFVISELESAKAQEDYNRLNFEIEDMFRDYLFTRKHKVKVHFITKSRFQKCLEGK